jgi:hypothetical protein
MTKSISCIKFDPYDKEKNRFAVMSEDSVKVYDLRVLQRP